MTIRRGLQILVCTGLVLAVILLVTACSGDETGEETTGVTGSAGITVTPTSDLVVTEAGGTDTFTAVLDTQPTADVTIGISSSDTGEARLQGGDSPDTDADAITLTFTAANWNTAQTVTVVGQADALAEAGCDLIVAEMMIDAENAGLVLDAANATGLPVWIGFSASMNADGAVTGYHAEIDFADMPAGDFGGVADDVLAHGGQAAGIMHSEIEVPLPDEAAPEAGSGQTGPATV